MGGYMRLIDADALTKVVEGWKKPKVYSEADERQNAIIECILYNIRSAPPIPLPDFKDGYKKARIDGKTIFIIRDCGEENE